MIRVSGNKVVVQLIADPDKSPGGIWIPEQAKDRSDQGIVKYIGPEVKDIKIGDYVLFSGYTGTLVILEGEGRLIIMPEYFVICKIVENPVTIVPGLFCRTEDGHFFEVSYEAAIQICAQTLTDLQKTISVVSERPKVEDYERS